MLMTEYLGAWSGLLLLGLVVGGVAHVIPRQRIDLRKRWPRDARTLGLVFIMGLPVYAAFSWLRPHYQALIPESVPRALSPVVELPAWLHIPLILLATDLLLYWFHRLLHTGRFWPLHRWHHAADELYWVTGLQGSSMHQFFMGLPNFLLYALFPLPGWELVLLLFLDAMVQHFTHSNWRVHLGPLEQVLITPRHHRIHHAREVALGNSNFGFVSTLWDRVFGTYVHPDEVPEDFAVGIEEEVSEARMSLGL